MHARDTAAGNARRMLWPYLYVLPALAALGFAFGYPLVQVVRESFYAGSFDSRSGSASTTTAACSTTPSSVSRW